MHWFFFWKKSKCHILILLLIGYIYLKIKFSCVTQITGYIQNRYCNLGNFWVVLLHLYIKKKKQIKLSFPNFPKVPQNIANKLVKPIQNSNFSQKTFQNRYRNRYWNSKIAYRIQPIKIKTNLGSPHLLNLRISTTL